MTTNKQLAKSFAPKEIETELYQHWESKGYFSPRAGGTPYSIAIPPPNITGTLHLGHAFQQTLMDTLTRYKRMSGFDTLWQTGTDHAGISTQMVVTEQLKQEGVSLHELGREKFVERVWKWREQSGGDITYQMRRLGASVDWQRERFTMDEGFSHAVLEVFVRLYEEGLIYRGKRLVNWDPKFQTALSDLEVLSEPEPGNLWKLKYPLATEDSNEYVVVATTRPETMLGDTAVAVHPEDSRYKHLVGQYVTLPLANRKIPVIADHHVDPEFGTGCLKITPAHDFDDYEIGLRHDLPVITVIDFAGNMNDNAPAEFRGLDRFQARDKVVSALKSLDLLEGTEPYEVQIPRGERSGVIVEPLLTDQWFVDIKKLAVPAIKAVESEEVRFFPKRWENVFFSWMHDLKDWCISRQLWWGHRIPAWYDPDGNIYVGRSISEVRNKYELTSDLDLTQDPDVLETWFSSALWTFGTLGWPELTDDFKRYHPTDVLITGHDIIFFWVARMIMLTKHFTNQVPFSHVYITGLIRDAEGQKMSKTKGNGIDPLDLVDGISLDELVSKRTSNLPQASLAKRIEKTTRREYPKGIQAYGTDALRFTLCAMASPSSSYNFDIARVEGYHYFCNKLWNSLRYVEANTQDWNPRDEFTLSTIDKWIRSRLHELVQACRKHLDSYRFDLYAQVLYEFVWHEFCDWYLELTKPTLYSSSDHEACRGVQQVLLECSDAILRLAHPVMPYITESLWKTVANKLEISGETLMLAEYPKTTDFEVDRTAETCVDWLKDVINTVRSIRGERRIPPHTEVTVLLKNGTDQDQQLLEDFKPLLCKLAKISTIEWDNNLASTTYGSTQIVQGMELNVPFLDNDEITKELSRLAKESSRVKLELERVNGKLENPNFMNRAPHSVVEAQQQKSRALTTQLTSLEQQEQVVRAALEEI